MPGASTDTADDYVAAMVDDDLERDYDIEADRDVVDMIADAGDSLVHVFIDGGVFDDVPLLRSLLGIGRGARAATDILLQRKLLSALNGFGTASQQERAQMLVSLERLGDERVGEQLLIAIDAASADLKATLIGRAYRRCLVDGIDASTLRRTVDMIIAANVEDLRELLPGAERISQEASFRLNNIGLVEGGAESLTSEGGTPRATVHGSLLSSL